MYEMLTGKPPFTGSQLRASLDQHLNDQPKGLREQGIDCPEWLEQIIMQLLEKDPEKRPFNARAVQGYLKEHLIDEFGPDLSQLTQYAPPIETEQSSRPGPDIRGLLVALLLIGGLVAAALIFSQ